VNVAQVKPGDVVAIYGASGGLGLSALQIATALGARVIAIGRQRWKLERARELGAAEVLSTQEVKEVDREVRRLTLGGADVSLDLTGRPEMVVAACRSTRPGGKIVVVSFTFEKVEVAINRLMWLELTLVGSRAYRPVDLRRVVGMVERGMVRLDKLVSHRFSLDEVNEAYSMLDEGKVLRAIVVP
jgi:Zn-dependent alcohol dehydrogenase